LLPDVCDDIGTPIVVTQFLVFGIGHSKEDVLFAFLHTPHATYAEHVGSVHYLGRVECPLPVDVIDASVALNAAHASETSVAFDCAELRNREEPRLSRFYFNVILDRHIVYSLFDGRVALPELANKHVDAAAAPRP
jgi:hypothetical protein